MATVEELFRQRAQIIRNNHLQNTGIDMIDLPYDQQIKIAKHYFTKQKKSNLKKHKKQQPKHSSLRTKKPKIKNPKIKKTKKPTKTKLF